MPNKGLHIAIIPDGNRRWAKKKGLLAWNGHEKAIENFRTLSDWCRTDPRVSTLTVWCFSTENWKRDSGEIAKLMKMLEDYLQNEREDFPKKKTRLLHSGRIDRIPQSLASLIAEISEETKEEKDFTLHLAVDYGGRDEVVRAIQKMKNSSSATEETVRSHLDHPKLPDIDLIIRTSGELRTSNFFLWQSTYAEWVFTEKFFPDFTTDDLVAAVSEYEGRTQRRGS